MRGLNIISGQTGTGQEPKDSRETDACKLANSQSLIWLGQQMVPETPLYEVVYTFEIAGKIAEETFQSAFQDFIEATPTLRTVASDPAWKTPLIRHGAMSSCSFFDLSQKSDPLAAFEKEVAERTPSKLDPEAALYHSALFKLNDEKFVWYLKLHHILTDASSGRLILEAMSDHYLARSNRENVPARPSYQSFVEYDTNIKETLGNNEWWNSRSSSREPTSFYRSSPAPETCHQHRESIVLTKEESDQLEQLALNPAFRQLTPAMSTFNLFATALVAWLYRLDSQNCARIGATQHGRMTPQFRRTAGLFMQLLPFQVEVDGKDTFETLSKKVAQETSGFLKNSVTSVMSSAMQKAFDVALNVIDLSVGDFAGMKTSMKWLHNGFGDPGRRLTVSVHRQAHSGLLELLFDFSVEAFSEEERSRAITHLRTVLSKMCTGPDTQLSEVDLLTSKEKAFLESNLGTTTKPSKEDVWEKFSLIVSQYSSEQAVHGIQKNYTFGELDQSAHRLAKGLNENGCGKVVPLICRRDENAVVGMFAILCSGRCFLPIDADYPEARIDQLLQDSGANWMLDARGEPRVVAIDNRSSNHGNCDLIEEGCYVLYTSGSSGKPNGVVVGHHSLLNLLGAFEDLGLIAQSNCSWWTNVGFDVAIYEIFSALLYGRTLSIPEDRIRNSPDEFFSWLNTEQIESAYLPPFYLEAFHSFLAEGKDCQLKRLLVGVEPIPQSLLASIANHLPNLSLINGYGPTEATVCATLQKIDRSDRSDVPASIGRPVNGNQLRIVDSNNCETPPGVPGELLIGGVGLALGYMGNPKLTKERFVSAPGEKDSPQIWYRTGDSVALQKNGCLQFLGRIDEQVKVRGHRIEPTEIAISIRAHETVRDCTVIPTEKSPIELWAFYTSTEPLSPSDLRDYLHDRLPRHLLPAKFHPLDTLPRTQNGKSDRKALLNLIEESLSEPREIVPASTPLQATLLKIWKTVFRTDSLGITDNFFDLGGDSLDAAAIAAGAEKEGIRVAPGLLFQQQTITLLAKELETNLTPEIVLDSKPRQQVPLPPALTDQGFTEEEVDDFYPLSSVQRAMLLRSLSSVKKGVYVTQITFNLSGEIDPIDLRTAWERVFAKVPVLRTCFTWEGLDDPLQIVMKSIEMPWQIEDWRNCSVTEQSQNFDNYLDADRVRGFDLSKSPLSRFLLAQKSDTDWRCVWTSNHLLLDGLSTLNIFREMWQELESVRNLTHVAASKLVPFRNYISWLGQQDTQALEAFWKDELRGYEEPTNLVIHGEQHQSGYDRIEKKETFELSKILRSMSTQHRLTLSSVIHGAWALVLHAYTGKSDIVFGSTVSGRPSTLPNANQIVGCCINTLPVRIKIDPEITPANWLARVQQTLVRSREYEHTSLQAIQNWSEVPATRSLFDSIVVFESYGKDIAAPPESSHLTMGELELVDQSDFPLALLIHPNEEQVCYQAIYDKEIFSSAGIERLLENLTSVLTSFFEARTESLNDIQFLAEEEFQQLASWSKSSLEKQSFVPILDLIAKQCEAHPDHPAIVFDRETVSYKELDRLSDALAKNLRYSGICSGDRVALCLERSTEMIVGILGILKAGAAYVPIDPSFPGLRREQMVTDSKARALLTRRKLETGTGFHIDLQDSSTNEGKELAYIIFTSGSTGKPKMVGVTHENLAFSTAARMEYYQEGVSAFLLLSAFTFDSSVAGIFWTLGSGGTLILPKDGEEKDLEQLSLLVDEHQVTHTLCLPSLLAILLKSPFPRRFQSLKTAIVAGESCPPKLAGELREILPDCQLYNEYGPTEATVWCSVSKVAHGPVSIGGPIPGAQIQILDERGRTMPIGAVGEICVSGPGVVPGYLGENESSANCFQVDQTTGERRYRTGDLGCWLESGELHFLGRRDGQVKVRGHRIELAEIEISLQKLEGVADAALIFDEKTVGESAEELTSALEKLDLHEAEGILDEIEAL